MKKIILVFSLAFMSVSVFAQSKIGTIDAEYIINQMPEMTEVTAGLKLTIRNYKTNLESTVATYETLVKDYQ